MPPPRPVSIQLTASAPVRAAAGARELIWTWLGNFAFHASLVAVASAIPMKGPSWLFSVSADAPRGDNAVELSAAFLDARAEPGEAAPTLTIQATPVAARGTAEVAPRKVDLAPLGSEPALADSIPDSSSVAEAAPPSTPTQLQTTRREPPQEQPQVAEASQETSSTSSRSLAAAPPAVGSPDALPSEVHNPFPAYPPELLARRIQATVVLRIKIAADGSVAEAAVHRSSGYESMDRAALVGVKSWKFKPAMKNGKPVETIVRKPIAFEIRE